MATKPLIVSPLTGVLDLRSSPDLIPKEGVRMRQNLQTVADGKLRRGTGWPKLLTKANYNNADFHDQLLTFGGGARQPVTLLSESQSSSGVRSLFIAQQRRILRLSEHGGNLKVLGSGFGGAASTSATAPRFRTAQVGDYKAFTNDWEKPKYHILEQMGEDGESLYEFEDLAVIGLTKAKYVWEWRGFLIFANVEMDGRRYPYRIVSSDFDNPTSFDPAKVDSIAWSKDLMTHEEILGGRPAGNSFLIYTTQGIWEMSIVGGEQTVGFRRAYNGEDNEFIGLLAYPNLLVNYQDLHLYAAKDGLYVFNQFYSRPERPEWLHRASALIYDAIDDGACEAHVAGIYGEEVLISVAETGATNACPNVTLRLNLKYQVADKLDFGFTALGSFTSQDIQSVRDFIVENGVLTMANMLALEPDVHVAYVNEGLPNPQPVAGTPLTCIHTEAVIQMGGAITAAGAGTADVNGAFPWNPATARYENGTYFLVTTSDGTTRTWEIRAISDEDALLYSTTTGLEGLWTTTETDGSAPPPTFTLGAGISYAEDYEHVGSHATSLCTLLGAETVEAGCRGCPSPNYFVGASSEDWCLKQLGEVFYREQCTNPTAVGTTITEGYESATGSYILNGYDSIFRSGPLFAEEGGVQVSGLSLDYQARPQTPASNIGLRVGISGQIADPNTGECMVWHQRSLQPLKCQSGKTEAQHKATNTQPAMTLGWEFVHKGPVLYFELKISGTGGDVDLSRIRLAEVSQYEIRRY